MRFVYICAECANYIGEIELVNWDETMLGFDMLTSAEKQELLDLDLQQRQGTVKAICDACYQKKITSPVLANKIEDLGSH